MCSNKKELKKRKRKMRETISSLTTEIVDNCHGKGTLKTIIDFKRHFDSDL